MITNWRFIDSGAGEAAFNMALDEVLLGRVAAGQSPPVLRVYRWSGQSVSLGYHQDATRELDLELCASQGVAVVRRPTGGRSVFHGPELTYSLAAPGDTGLLGSSVSDTSAAVAAAIRHALELLGAVLDSPDDEKNSSGGRGASGMRNPCFTSASRHEVTSSGRKLVGSAQMRLPGGTGFLQHGSLLLENHQFRLAELKPLDVDSEQRQTLTEHLNNSVTSLSGILGREVSYAETADAFRRGFAGHFMVELLDDKPGPDELRMAEHLAGQRYRSSDWLLGKRQKANFGDQKTF
jgi:lipoate-protein ligase A